MVFVADIVAALRLGGRSMLLVGTRRRRVGAEACGRCETVRIRLPLAFRVGDEHNKWEALQHRTPSHRASLRGVFERQKRRPVDVPRAAPDRSEVLSRARLAVHSSSNNLGTEQISPPHAGSDSVSAVLASSDRRSGHVDQP